ncbi:hypothetical protein C1H46_039840 [Malus baccata]|uniref:Uncharacterized protein n=1 Tax=Malus baccata TaxID=106549 RepID=A0A540KK85_MALBA|nr:hypothetical protein C1H46_039840 [Malus baccata]
MDPQLWHKVAALSVWRPFDCWNTRILRDGVDISLLDSTNPCLLGSQGFAFGKLHIEAIALSTESMHHSGGPFPAVFSEETIFMEVLTLCYTVALLEDRKYSTLAPFGGFAFIAAWGSLLF